MLRTLLCAVLGVSILAGCSSSPTSSSSKTGLSDRGPRAFGTIVSVDPAAGTLTVKVRNFQTRETEEKTYQVEDETKITSYTGQDKKELKGKDGLNDPQFKADSRVSLRLSDDRGKATSIEVGDLPNRRGGGPGGPPRARGTIVRVDPAAGTLTANVRSRQKPDGEEKTYQVEDETTITSYTGQDKKEMKGKDGLNDPQFKAGSQVGLTLSEDGSKVTSIQVGDLPQRGRGGRGGRGGGQGRGQAPMQ